MIFSKNRNVPGWATKEDNLIPNGVKCNENVIWVSVLRLCQGKCHITTLHTNSNKDTLSGCRQQALKEESCQLFYLFFRTRFLSLLFLSFVLDLILCKLSDECECDVFVVLSLCEVSSNFLFFFLTEDNDLLLSRSLCLRFFLEDDRLFFFLDITKYFVLCIQLKIFFHGRSHFVFRLRCRRNFN